MARVVFTNLFDVLEIVLMNNRRSWELIYIKLV